ncbi:MAG: DNA-formamidopyrimidine glycosylase family protein [Saprospiraceae bacterium]|nr:DNA-formamidopyrimidine glycosylase family protein [Saprospiraceae bacterium]
MPELPEVNTVQKYFDLQAAGKRIDRVVVADDHIIRNLTGDAFASRLEAQTITGSYRQGKYLFATLGSGHHVQLHLGMTGDLVFYQDLEDRPPHERFAWHLSDGFVMGFKDPRKFGRILYLEDLSAYLEEIRLGPDALVITEAEFLERMEGRTTRIKPFLLDQTVIAGVGNLYADEICYQCRVHPASRIDAIPLPKRKALFRSMREILQWACDHDAYYGVYPDNWFCNWGEEGKKNPHGRGRVRSIKLGGRGTFFVPGWQRLYGS